MRPPLKHLYHSPYLALCLLVLTLVSCTYGSGIAPTPYCQSKPLYKQFPLAREQIISHDMADSFSGYNLKIELTSKNSFAVMTQKMIELDRRNTYLASIISHSIEKTGNTVAKDSFILYKDISGSVHFTYGQIESKTQLPELNNTLIVTAQKNIECFDAALFLEYGLAIVDCVKVNANNTEKPFTNVFYYMSLTQHRLEKIVQNDVYINFGGISQRKLLKLKHGQTAQTYLIRAYLSEGVKANKQNTYLEVFGASDPENLQPLGVIDRTFLHEKILSITDVKIYNGHIILLDYNVGAYRLKIAKDHQIYIHGTFKQRGMQKIAVYSDDLQEELILALANGNNVYQIDWGNMFSPKTINKYTLISDSIIQDLHINKHYVVVQSKATVNNASTGDLSESPLGDTEVDYTWIFTKGSRTYMNAYQIIDHNSSKVQIDFDQQQSHLYTADEKGLGLFKLDEARLSLHFIDEAMLGKSEDIVITATSSDPHSKNGTVTCNSTLTAIFVDRENSTIFDTGFEMTNSYSANYPGELHIPLSNRYMGPNITYSLDHLQSKQIPQYWINKKNYTRVEINSQVKPQDIQFFSTDQLNLYGRELLVYYYEDTKNVTRIAECLHIWQDQSINCDIVKQYHNPSHLEYFASSVVQNDQGWDYYYMFVLQGEKEKVHVIDYIRHRRITLIEYSGHQEAIVNDIAANGDFLYVLRRSIKTIDVYSLTKCEDAEKCEIQFSITKDTVKGLGVDYFAPEYIETDAKHPEVLFIKCLGSVLVLDIDNKERIHKIDEISKSQAVKDPYFRMAVNEYRMVLTATPNIIEEYSLQNMYKAYPLPLMKNYPTYGYMIQPNADIEFTEMDSMVYVNAYDPKVNVSVVLIYRSGYPSSATLYDVIYLDQLYSRPGFQVEVSGSHVDFVSIAAGNEFMVYRVFEEAFLSLNDTFSDYSMNVKAQNPTSNLETGKISVAVVNYPTGFAPTAEFNSTLENLQIENSGAFNWNDRNWFDGHVVGFLYACEDCPGDTNLNPKVKLKEHIDQIGPLSLDGNDYTETKHGGVGVYKDLFTFFPNGTVKNFINLPDQKLLETCLKTRSFQTGDFIITACQSLGRGINLYLTSMQSFKPATFGPFVTDAYYVLNMDVVHDVVMIVDQSMFPESTQTEGSVFLYRVSVNSETEEEFEFLDEIDNGDFLAAHGWNQEKAMIGSAELTYSGLTDTFRLYVTELNGGFFIIDFTRHTWEAEIHILAVRYINMNEILESNNLHMPTDSTYRGITFTGIHYDEDYEADYVVVTTKKYHHFELLVSYDKTNQVKEVQIKKVFKKYGYYEGYSEVVAGNGYVAVGYLRPSLYAHLDVPKQYVAVYDTANYDNPQSSEKKEQEGSDKNYTQRYILGALPIDNRNPCTFSFNKTYDHHSNGTRIGMVISQSSKFLMTSTSLSKQLQLQTKQGFKNQQMVIIAYSDYKAFAFEVSLVDDDLNDSALLTIVIILAAVLVVFFVCYLCSVFYSRKKQQNDGGSGRGKSNERQSLLTENDSFIEQRPMVNPQNQKRKEGSESKKKGEYVPPEMIRERSESSSSESSSGSSSSDSEEESSNESPNKGALETYEPEERDLSIGSPRRVPLKAQRSSEQPSVSEGENSQSNNVQVKRHYSETENNKKSSSLKQDSNVEVDRVQEAEDSKEGYSSQSSSQQQEEGHQSKDQNEDGQKQKKGLKAKIHDVKDLINEGAKKIDDQVRPQVKEIKANVKPILSEIKEDLKPHKSDVKEVVFNKDKEKGRKEKAKQIMKDKAESSVDKHQQKIEEIVGEKAQDLKVKAKKEGEEKVEKGKEKLQDAKEKIKDKKSDTKSKVEDKQQAIQQKVKHAKSEVKDSAKGAKQSAKKSISEIKQKGEKGKDQTKQAQEEADKAVSKSQYNIEVAKEGASDLKEKAEEKQEKAKEKIQEGKQSVKETVDEGQEKAEKNLKEGQQKVQQDVQEGQEQAKEAKQKIEGEVSEAKEDLGEKATDLKSQGENLADKAKDESGQQSQGSESSSESST